MSQENVPAQPPTGVGLDGLRSSVREMVFPEYPPPRFTGLIGTGGITEAPIADTGGVMRMKWLLFWTYLTRAVAIAVYLAAPKTALTFYVFAAVLGFTWLSTVPPTAGLVGKLFGTRYLATLFGLTLLSHQIGGFFGAWLGGIALVSTGNYSWMWYADMGLAAVAAFVNLPIEEAPLPAVRTAAA